MQELAGLIEEGAMAFLRREYLVLLPFILLVALLLAWGIGVHTGLAYLSAAPVPFSPAFSA